MPRDLDRVRASDADRERVAEALAVHWREGRLDLEAFDARTARAYSAETVGDLEALIADLPGPSAVAARPGPPRRRRWLLPGLRPFHEEAVLRSSPEQAFDDALRDIVPKLSRAEYQLAHTERPRLLRFSHKAAFSGQEKALTITLLEEPGGGTRLVAFGEAPRSVRAAFATLAD